MRTPIILVLPILLASTLALPGQKNPAAAPAAKLAELAPMEAALACQSKINTSRPATRKIYFDCANPHFDPDQPLSLRERLIFWLATNPPVHSLHVCSAKESEDIGAVAGTEGVLCFEKPGYVFLKKKDNRWYILNIKY